MRVGTLSGEAHRILDRGESLIGEPGEPEPACLDRTAADAGIVVTVKKGEAPVLFFGGNPTEKVFPNG